MSEVKNSIDTINVGVQKNIVELKEMMNTVKSSKGVIRNLEKQYQQKEKNVQHIKSKLNQIITVSKGV